MAVAALIVSIVAILVTVALAIIQRIGDGQRDRRIEAIESTKADHLKALERAVAAGIDPAAAHERGAALSVFAYRSPTNLSGHDLWLVVRNLGPGGALVTNIETVNRKAGEQPRLRPAGGDELLPGGSVELLPGEEHAVMLLIYLGTELPITVSVAWQDGSAARRERIRDITMPPG